MKINADQGPGAAPDPPAPSGTRAANDRVSTEADKASTVEAASTKAGTAVVTPAQRQTEVSLKRDTSGRIYYVVSDSKSGAEILEVPPKSVRDVDEGIQDYLKQLESKGSGHLEEKA